MSDSESYSNSTLQTSIFPNKSLNISRGNVFLSLFIFLKQWIIGAKDALNVIAFFQLLSSSKEARYRVVDVIMFNGIICFGNLGLFQFIIEPFIIFLFESQNLYHTEGWLAYLSRKYVFLILGYYYVFWAVPIFLLSFVINNKWLDSIAKCADTASKSRTYSRNTFQIIDQMPKTLASKAYSTTFAPTFVVQSLLCFLVPVLGTIINMIILCWLYSLYCFEYKWPEWSIGKRLNFIEQNWAYFSGFGMVVGLPFTIASVRYGFWIGYVVWWLLFPFFVVLAILSNDPPNIESRPEMGRSMALFRAAKWMNALCLNFLAVVINLLTS